MPKAPKKEFRSSIMMRAPVLTVVLGFALACEFGVVAAAAEQYTVAGKDSFSIGADAIRSSVSYTGRQTLSIHPRGKDTRYTARVAYTRSDGDAQTRASGDYVADISASGEVLDSADHDPDYLTVLNQPFSARLDPPTLDDLRHLRGALPFAFPSPFTGSSLRGYLQRSEGGAVGSRHAVGVTFEAAGPMKGALPDRPGLTLIGTITMRGTALYETQTGLLLALDTTVTIVGNVSNRTGNDPVTITYHRTIRAQGGGPPAAARKSP